MLSRVPLLPLTQRIVALIMLGGCLLSPVHAFGQTPAIPRGTNAVEIKAAAEGEGATFPTVKAQSDSARPRACVDANELGTARSGEFTIGGNIGARAMRAGRQGKVWWAPLYAARDMPALLVRGRSLTNVRDTVRFASSKVAWPGVPGGPSIPEAQRTYFFPSGITIPQAGRWLLVATSGRNWGCFILTVS